MKINNEDYLLLIIFCVMVAMITIMVCGGLIK